MAASKTSKKKSSNKSIGGSLLARRQRVNPIILATIIVLLGGVGIYLKFFSHAGAAAFANGNIYSTTSVAALNATQVTTFHQTTETCPAGYTQSNYPQFAWDGITKFYECANFTATTPAELATALKIYRSNLDNSNPVNVATTPNFYTGVYTGHEIVTDWAPSKVSTNQKIAFAVFTAAGKSQIKVLDVATGTVSYVKNTASKPDPTIVTPYQIRTLNWQPDDSGVLYTVPDHYVSGNRWWPSICTIALSGQVPKCSSPDATKLTGNLADLNNFSYDLTQYTVQQFSTADGTIQGSDLVNIPTGTYTPLPAAKNTPAQYFPGFSPDGRYLLLSQGSGSSTLANGDCLLYDTTTKTSSTAKVQCGYWQPIPLPVKHVATDWDGNRTSDLATFNAGSWGIYNGAPSAISYGTAGDIAVPADYNGDGSVERAVYRPSGFGWYINGAAAKVYGMANGIPVPGDYNGDGKAEPAVFNPVNSSWYISTSGSAIQWGAAGDIPVPGDYNGDGKTDLAIYRPSTFQWYIKGIATTAYGAAGDIPIPADYNGDGKTDIAIFRPSTYQFYIFGQQPIAYGTKGDVPVPADYNGDGKADIAVYRPSSGTWYVQGIKTVQYGNSTTAPLELPYAIRSRFFPALAK